MTYKKNISARIKQITSFYKGKNLSSFLVRSGTSNLIIRVAFTLLSFLLSIVLARFMGDVNYGAYSKVYALVMVLSVPAQFGLPNLIMRETAKSLVTKSWSSIKGIWQWSTRITVFLVLIITVGTLLFLHFFPNDYDGERIKTLYWGLVLVPLISLGALRGAALRGLHKIVHGQLPEHVILPGLFITISVIVGIIQPGLLSPRTVMMLQATAALIAFILGTVLLWKATPADVQKSKPTFHGKVWMSSVFSLALISGMQLLNKWISILILGWFVDDAQIAIYRIAVQMAILADFGLQVANPVIAPQIARLHSMGDHKRLQKLAVLSARFVLAVNLIITIGFIVLGRQFLAFSYGKNFVAAYSPLLILLVGQLINSMTGSVGYILNMTGYEGDTAIARVVSTVLNIGINLILSPKLGVLGAAIASSISMIIWNISLWVLVKKRLGIISFALYNLKAKKDE